MTETLTPAHYDAASLLIADAIGECDFGLRERFILEVIRRRSYGSGRTEAYIPRLDYFASAGITKGNASKIINFLKRSLVIEERPEKFYGFIVPASGWRVPGRLEMSRVMEQLSLIPEPEHLRSAMRENFIETALQNLPTRGSSNASVPSIRSTPAGDDSLVTTRGHCRESVGPEQQTGGEPVVKRAEVRPSPAFIATQVPNSGTAGQNQPAGSQFGNHEAKPQPVRALRKVPDSEPVPY